MFWSVFMVFNSNIITHISLCTFHTFQITTICIEILFIYIEFETLLFPLLPVWDYAILVIITKRIIHSNS